MPTSLTSSRRRVVATLGAAAAALAMTATVTATPAHADNSSTLTIVGTSDVYDSNLVQSVIKPDFEAKFPGKTLNYVSLGTGAAIAYAEAGSASALLVHAPSLENQFVASGYSANDQPGRALFWGDYVLLGPKSDPAGIADNDAHNIAGAFARIARAGAQGNATYVSRGGTPGTTVQEHAIWALTKGVKTCTVSAANGGGASPSTTTGDCPATISYPSWYKVTGLTQGPNIENADTCNYPNGNCYVFTDRGTYQYLVSTDAISNLQIVTRDNNVSAPGGNTLLVNTFHAYAVNPDAVPPGSQLNTLLAEKFLTWVTAPAEQTAIGQYLNGTEDPPFIPDASPRLTATAPQAATTGAQHIKISGRLSNVVPGTPPLANQTVTLFGTNTATKPQTRKIASTTTDSAGKYSFSFAPSQSRTYTVKTGQLTVVEYPDLDPPFSDILAPASTTAGSSELTGGPTITSAQGVSGGLQLAGDLAPAPTGSGGRLTLYASKNGAAEKPMGNFALTAGQTSYSHTFPLSSGSYTYRVGYADRPYVSLGYSHSRTTVVP